MKRNIVTGEFTESFAKAQSEFNKLIQDKSGYNYTYLTLPNILNELRPILGRNGLAFTQSSELEVIMENPFCVVTTVIMHKSEYIETTIKYPLGDAPKGMTEIQYMGSIFSYLRRYAALGILGIAGTEKEIEDIQMDVEKETKLKG